MTKYVLGIETSCDDTAVAIVDNHGRVVSSIIADQNEIHTQYGGVYPELAGRAHTEAILPTINNVLGDAGLTPDDLTAIGVTRGPGLIGSLLVGLNTACGLGMAWKKPVIGINHLRGHLRSADLEEKRVVYPATILLVSGGHSFLAHMKSQQEITLLGSTRDDSVGETYDKVARMLGLGYPGGAAVDRLAAKGNVTIQFPRPMLNQGLEFSFSGLKSSVSRYMSDNKEAAHEDIAASFVDSVLQVLISKCKSALKDNASASLVVVGGVAASPQLREAAGELCEDMNVKLCLPPLKWSTDNGAMIAMATWDYIHAGVSPKPLPQVRLPIYEY